MYFLLHLRCVELSLPNRSIGSKIQGVREEAPQTDLIATSGLIEVLICLFSSKIKDYIK
jgi:hypothetical protein